MLAGALREENGNGINFPQTEAKRLLKTNHLPFFIGGESQEVIENKGS
jgi:hypothetical protein